MQISMQEVLRARKRVAQGGMNGSPAPVGSVEELAARHSIGMEEVRRVTQTALMAEEDPARERRVRDLARRIAEGRYHVDAEQILEMAERRSLADRASHY